MSELSFPWLSALALIPALGAACALIMRGPSYPAGLVVTALSVIVSAGAWIFSRTGSVAMDPFCAWLVMDDLNAPLLVCSSLIAGVLHLTTPRAARSAASTAKLLATLALTLVTFMTVDARLMAALFIAGSAVAWLDLRSHSGPSRVFSRYMALSAALMAIGVASDAASWAWAPIAIAILIRKGIVPFHSWMPPFFQCGSPPVVVLFSMPQIGTYCALRLLIPAAPAWALAAIGIASLATSVYAASLALVQTNARRMFAFFFMSQSALVLAGIGCANLVGLTGSLTLWISSALSLSGLGAVFQALEARRGELSVDRFQGGYDRMPALACCFLIMGLACVGFPGTMGFVAEEMLVAGATQAFPAFGVFVGIAAAINGITILKSYGYLFCGTRWPGPFEMRMRPREQIGVLVLAAILIIGGLWPAPWVASGAAASQRLLSALPPSAVFQLH